MSAADDSEVPPIVIAAKDQRGRCHSAGAGQQILELF
jgi:hypothetical protein